MGKFIYDYSVILNDNYGATIHTFALKSSRKADITKAISRILTGHYRNVY